MAHWVALHPLFEVCAKEKGYEEVGHRREAWWRQEATEKQHRATWTEILQESKRKRKFGQSGLKYEPEGGDVESLEVGILGWIRDTPRWANELV